MVTELKSPPRTEPRKHQPPRALTAPPTVAVIGAGGRIGLPLSLAMVRGGMRVAGIDTNVARCQEIMAGAVGFVEDGADEALTEALSNELLTMSDDLTLVRDASTIVVIIGTPVDEQLNPVTEPLTNLAAELGQLLTAGQLVVLRSTVAPGTTEQVRAILERQSGLKEGRDFFLVFAPDRSQQGRVLEELPTMPQIIGAFSDAGYEAAAGFFATLTSGARFQMTPVEAELGKLFTNMTRYANFALVNEYYLLAEEFGANVHRVIDSCNWEYPRLNLPTPGPNVGGPCLYKDGFFLVNHVPFADLISTSFRVNEAIPVQVARKVSRIEGVRKVAILGMAFKADSDDTRNSLSFRLKKALQTQGVEIACYDPLVPRWSDGEAIRECDAAVLMTPHSDFKDLGRLAELIANPACTMVDIWGFWDEARGRSNNGYFTLADFS